MLNFAHSAASVVTDAGSNITAFLNGTITSYDKTYNHSSPVTSHPGAAASAIPSSQGYIDSDIWFPAAFIIFLQLIFPISLSTTDGENVTDESTASITHKLSFASVSSLH